MTDLEIKRNRLSVPMEVVIPRIVEIGLQEQPKEACGVIVPSLLSPPREWVKQLKNRSTSPLTSYDIDPATIKSLLAQPDAWADVLIWHTHPSGVTGPSRGDMLSRIEGLNYLVVALPHGEAATY